MTVAQLLRKKCTLPDGQINFQQLWALVHILADSFSVEAAGFLFHDGSVIHVPQILEHNPEDSK